MDEGKTKDLLAIFFDLDNTLIPTRRADAAACNQVNKFAHLISLSLIRIYRVKEKNLCHCDFFLAAAQVLH